MKKIKIIFTMLLIGFKLFGQGSNQKLLNAITISSSIPNQGPGKFDSISVFQIHSIKLYKVCNMYTSYITGESGNLKTDEGEITDYYAFDTKNSIGIHFNKNKIDKFDSSISYFENQNIPFKFLTTTPQFFPKDTIKIDSNFRYNWIETHTGNNRTDLKLPDSVIMYYNKDFLNFDYSLGFPKEKELNLKLQKIRMIFNLKKVPEWNASMPETMEMSIELKPVSQEAWDVAMTYYERAKKEFAKYIKE